MKYVYYVIFYIIWLQIYNIFQNFPTFQHAFPWQQVLFVITFTLNEPEFEWKWMNSFQRFKHTSLDIGIVVSYYKVTIIWYFLNFPFLLLCCHGNAVARTPTTYKNANNQIPKV